jgi:hypothetical protein
MLGLRLTSAIQGWPKGGGGPAGIESVNQWYRLGAISDRLGM